MRAPSLGLVLAIVLIVLALPAWSATPSPAPVALPSAAAGTIPVGGAATVSLLVYSGRPDPAWPIDAGQLERLEAIVSALDPVEGEPAVGGLGFHGFSIDGPTGRSVAYEGTVQTPGLEPGTYLSDPERDVERFLLETGRAYLSDVELEAVALGLVPAPSFAPAPSLGPDPSLTPGA